MKHFLLLFITLFFVRFSFGQIIITGVLDGPLTGGIPKVIELYVAENIADLSIYGFGSANNGGGTDGEELTLSGSASSGDFLYIASEIPFFNTFFGFDPDFTSNAAAINGDDAVELFKNGTVIDVFGDINTDGNGEAWEYLDGWAYRNNSTGPDASTFTIASWTFSGINALDGESTNSSASTPFPTGTYSSEGGTTVTISAPTFDPTEGTYSTTQNVSISCSTEGASIYYTLDESTPDSTSTLYTTPIALSISTTIKAIAYTETLNSIVSTATYTFEISSTNALLPYEQNFTIDEGNFTTFSTDGSQEWSWKNYDGGSMVMSGYESPSSNVNTDWLISPTFDFSSLTNLELNYSEAINYITSYDDLQVMISSDYDGTSVATATWNELTITGRPAGDAFTFEDVDTIDLSAYEGLSTITIAFKYTSSADNSSTWEISKVTITGDEAMIAEPSNHVTNFSATTSTITQTSIELSWTENDGTDTPNGYLIKASTASIEAPVNGINPDDDTDLTDGSGNVKVMHGTSTYTFENCSPGTAYNFSLFTYIANDDTIVFKIDDAPSTMGTTLESNETPFFSPATATHMDSVWVSISTETTDAVIYYTLDGSTPTGNSMLYSSIFKLTENTTVKAIAIKGDNSSSIAEISYIITDSQTEVALPTFTPIAGTYADSVEVTITCATDGAIIYYTLDGSMPSTTTTLYSSAFQLKENTTVRAIAYVGDFASTIAEAQYVVTETLAPIDVTTLADLRAGQTDGTIYHFTGEALVTFAMDFRNQKYIQDATAAILIDDSDGAITSSFEIGNGIGDLTGTLSDYNGMLEFIPSLDASKSETPALTIETQTLSITEFTSNFEDYEAELIRFSHVHLTETGSFANGTDYAISDGNENTVLRSHFYNVDYIGTAMPEGIVNVTGIALWDQDAGKIAPRMASDIEDATSVSDTYMNSKVYSFGEKIIIEQATTVNLADVYSIDGQKVKSEFISNGSSTIVVNKRGIYLVVLSNNSKIEQTKKVVIQ